MNLSNYLNNVKLPFKMLGIGILALVSVAIPTSYFYNTTQAKIILTEQEKVGMIQIKDLIYVQKYLGEHRGITARVFSGDKTAEGLRFEKSGIVDAHFEQIEQTFRNTNEIALLAELKSIKRSWSTLKSNILSEAIDARTAFTNHSAIITDAAQLTSLVLEHSGLYYDPEPASHHLVMANMKDLPRLTDAIGKVRGKVAGILSKGTINNAEKSELRGFLSGINYPAYDLSLNLQAAAKANPQFSAMSKQAEEFDQKLQALLTLVNTELLNKTQTEYSAALFFDNTTTLINGIYDVHENINLQLKRVLAQRVQEINTARAYALGTIILTALLSVLLGGVLVYSVLGSIKGLSEHFASIAKGEFIVSTEAKRKDEIGGLFKQLNKVTDLLAENKIKADEAFQVKQALDNSSTAFMLSDHERKIMYANKATTLVLEGAENQIKQTIAHFSAQHLLGQKIDMFMKNTDVQGNDLASLTHDLITNIRLGQMDFRLIITPIFNVENTLVGYSTELHDMTTIFEEERKQRRILESLNCTTTNVMIADADDKIIYLNGSIERMLAECEKDIQEAIPHFSSAKIIGNSMDIFHKNPNHQTALIANLQNTHEAQIQIGKRHFRFIINPIQSDSGERLGAVVEWLDRTKEVNAENEISAMVNAALQGDFTQRISTENKDGFLAKISTSLNEFIDVTETGLADVNQVLNAIAQGDLTQRVENEYTGVFQDMKNYCNDSCDKLSEMIASIRHATETINLASSEISQGNMDLSSRTEEQASSLEQTASTMDEITGTVKLNAQNAEQANHLSSEAAAVAFNGGDLIQQVVNTMSSINDSAEKIANIISVIDSIAFQTNILALNAAVEAARAGEQGRGFAVVAAEVRTLAQRSADAAKDIKHLITDSVDKVTNGNQLVHQSGETMKEIVVSIQRVNDIMGEIASASSEQSISIDEVSNSITQMDEMTQQNAALVEEAAASSESLRVQAEQLTLSVSEFSLAEQHDMEFAEIHEPAPVHQHMPRFEQNHKTAKPTPRLTRKRPSADDEWENF